MRVDADEARPWPVGGLEALQACPLCAAGERHVLYAGLRDAIYGSPGSWTIYGCRHCGSGYLDPRPTPETIHLAYRTYYTHARAPRCAPPASSFRRLRRAVRNGYLNARYRYELQPASRLGSLGIRCMPMRRAELDRFVRHLERPPGLPRLLDVGCGEGGFLAQMEEFGWNATGVDPDAEAVERGREAGLSVRHGPLTHEAFPPASFHAVTMNHVIEHVHDPFEVILICRQLLRPDGVLWIATPNLSSYGHDLYGRYWRGLEPPRHLVLFTPQSLRGVLERAGFEVVLQLSSPGAQWMLEASEDVHKALEPADRPLLSRAKRRWTAPLADRRALREPDRGEEIVLLARRVAPQGANSSL